jgi:hypothetical protein
MDGMTIVMEYGRLLFSFLPENAAKKARSFIASKTKGHSNSELGLKYQFWDEKLIGGTKRSKGNFLLN